MPERQRGAWWSARGDDPLRAGNGVGRLLRECRDPHGCDAKLEEGSVRCDANISLRPVGQEQFGVKTEVKNMNSFRSVQKALEAEQKRHHHAGQNYSLASEAGDLNLDA